MLLYFFDGLKSPDISGYFNVHFIVLEKIFISCLLLILRKIEIEKKDNEIIYSKAIKAGKRIYYLDVKNLIYV